MVTGGRLVKQVLTGLGRQVLAGAPGFEETHEGEGGAGLARGANRSGQLRAEEHFESRGGGVYLNDSGRRLWLGAWSTFMAQAITLADGSTGPRWDVLDQLVRSFARFVDDPDRALQVPLRR